MTEPPSHAWLSLDEAAARLGVSRLRLREAIAAGVLPAQRDNRGFWRVSLDETPDARRRIAAAHADPAQKVELLFDEIEEVTAALAERNADVARLSALVGRQQDSLERALRLVEAPGTVERLAALNERSQALIDQTLAKLEGRDADLIKMSGMMDRALDTVAGLDAEATRQREIGEKQRALLDRLFAIAQTSLARFAKRGRGGWFSKLRRRRGELP